MKVLIDSDILRFEIAYGSEVGWKAITGTEELPPFDYVLKLLHERIDNIKRVCNADEHALYLTSGKCFRYAVAKRRPYKEGRKEERPFHFANLTAYISSLPETKIVSYLEADDQLAIDHTENIDTTIIASRDKDLRTVSGMSYSWEIGRQPSFGPEKITPEGYLKLNDRRNKLSGTGYSFFIAQLLMGDRVDNVPGCPGMGPVYTYELLNGKSPEEQEALAIEKYKEAYGENWEAEMTEQATLTWLVRRMKPDGTPQLWEMGLRS